MANESDDDSITIELDRSEALVMLEWLDRLEKPDETGTLTPFEAAVLTLRADLEAMIESSHPDVLAPDYQSRLESAAEDVRDGLHLED